MSMKPNDIKVGVTYRGNGGPFVRRVTDDNASPQYVNQADRDCVAYVGIHIAGAGPMVDQGRERSCTRKSFAKWATEVVCHR